MPDEYSFTEYLDEDGLKRYNDKLNLKIQNIYVKQETVEDQPGRQKVLSDNNLTDELKEKLENAGTSFFDGDYDSLDNIPTLNGVAIQGALSDEDLNLVTDDELEQATTTLSEQLTSSYEEYVDTKLISVYKPVGSIDSITDLPPAIRENLGNVYNVEHSFITTDDFVEGIGHEYPAGTNVAIVEPEDYVYKYDALSGIIDTSGLMGKDDIQPIPNSKIDALFTQ